MNIELLRSATAADHDAVEGAIPLMGTSFNLAVYTDVLRRIYGFASAWEEMAEQTGSQELQGMLIVRRRSSFILQDLHALTSKLPPLDLARIPAFASTAELIGAMYVMEGSRLGGAFIAKHAETVLAIKGGIGSNYFRGDPLNTSRMWRELTEYLRKSVADAQTDDVIAGAKLMFRAFNQWMRSDPILKNNSDAIYGTSAVSAAGQ